MRTADQRDAFETVFTKSTAGFFLREFCFSNTEFSPPNRSEVELADFVIQLDDLVIVFQVKTRQEPSSDPERERIWFEDKVIKKATRQVRDTVTYLQTYAPEIENDRGRRVALPTGIDVATIIKIVIFSGGPELPLSCTRSRFHQSKTAGFIHLIAAPDWRNIMETLVTPQEIVDYLRMRERLSLANAAQVRAVSEKALVGQFIADAENAPPSATFESTLDRLLDDRASFDILRFLNLFGDRLTSDPPPETKTPSDLRGASADYYPIIREIAKLPRTDWSHSKSVSNLGGSGQVSIFSLPSCVWSALQGWDSSSHLCPLASNPKPRTDSRISLQLTSTSSGLHVASAPHLSRKAPRTVSSGG